MLTREQRDELRRHNDNRSGTLWGDAKRLLDDLDAKEKALGDAAIVLEVLRAQIVMKPYAEMTADFQAEIVRVSDVARKALGIGLKEESPC